MPLRKCYFPTLAVYNLNFMGLSSKQRRNAHLSMVRHLMESHQIVGLEELHADTKRDANMFFFKQIHATKFYDSTVNMAILVNTEWANTHNPQHVDIVPGATHGIQWNSGAGRCFFIHIYLDATPATGIKVDQLNRIKQWATANIQPFDTIFTGGDRNHIRQVSEVTLNAYTRTVRRAQFSRASFGRGMNAWRH